MPSLHLTITQIKALKKLLQKKQRDLASDSKLFDQITEILLAVDHRLEMHELASKRRGEPTGKSPLLQLEADLHTAREKENAQVIKTLAEAFDP